MSLDWKDIAARVAALGAPVIGGALAGPLGAGVGRVAGQIVGSALGTPADPLAITSALDALAPGEAAIALAEAERAHREELLRLQLAHEAAELAQVNETMRAELIHGNAWQKGWRPMFGYVTAFGYGAILAGVAYVLVTGGDPALIGALGSVTVFLSVGLSVLGVTAYSRSTDKQTLAGIPQRGGIFDAVAERIRRGGA